MVVVVDVVVVLVVVVDVVVVDVPATGAQRRLIDLTCTACVPNWSDTVAVGVALGHFVL